MNPTLLPAKDKRAAIVGGGLAGLVAAWDLFRKGYLVTILARGQQLGGDLREFAEEALPKAVIEEELERLEQMGVKVRLGQPVEDAGWMEAVRAEFDAIYVEMDGKGGVNQMAPEPEQLSIDPATLSTSIPGVFIGEIRPHSTTLAPIEAVAEGRKAATSIDRYLQKVSLTAGREHEGPYATRLYTNLEGITPWPAVSMEDRAAGYSDEEAKQEAGRCIRCECMECVKNCLFLERFKSYPKRYVRQISNDETMVMGSHGQTISLVNSCSLCGLCEEVCPNSLAMAPVCMEGRASFVSRGKMAPSAHDFALTDMVSSGSDRAAISLHEPGKETSSYLFFPGCQMAAIYPDHVGAAYNYLRAHLKGGTGLLLRCCGVPAEWAARTDLFMDALRGLKEDWERLGKPIVVAACPTCHQTFKKYVPEMKVVMLWQILAESSDADLPRSSDAGTKLAIHDPCTTRHEPEMHDSIRALLTRLGYSIEELPLSRDKTECCGFGGLMSAANPPLAKDVARRRASESGIDYVTYCAMCRNALAMSGKRISHILDLCFPGSVPDPAAGRALGYSERSENRFRLKRTLLESLWGIKEEGMEGYENIDLHISDDVAARMEDRRILREDVRKVIRHAEKTGERLFSPTTERYRASFRPALVTYWVEYSAEGEGFRVYNTYCHRMEVVEEAGGS